MKHATNLGRILSVLLVLTMLVGAFAAFGTSASAAIVAPATDAEIWDGVVATEYAGGTGTAEDPYKISTPRSVCVLPQY